MICEWNMQKRRIDAGGVSMESRKTGLVRQFLSLMVLTVIVCGATCPSRDSGSRRSFPWAFGRACEAAEPDADAALQKQYEEADALFTAKEYAKAYETSPRLAVTPTAMLAPPTAIESGSRRNTIWPVAAFQNEQFAEAKALFESLENYKDSRAYLYKIKMGLLRAQYQQAKEAFASGDYQKARDLFTRAWHL